ncbi:MAG TPA: putative baseplate assembly protein [Gaiellaceae bacterium]|nr:putative baseplate assembly protein [Gaiellaceae bacterium]
MSECGCCAGISQRTPLEVANRPGLSAIAYRVGVHSDFYASMVAALTSPERPGLAQLGTRDDDDFTIALLDAWAVAADVIAFYTERLAQESYLRTAGERISLQELGRLIGFRLNPGVAAQTHVAFALEAPPDLPATVSQDPGSAPPVTPAAVTIETGLRVQSIPGPGEQPQTFETVEEIEAQPEWNALPASTTEPHTFVRGDTVAYFAGVSLNLKPGDALLLAGADILDESWDLRTLTSVEVQSDLDRTEVEWAEGLGSESPPVDPAPVPTPFVLRKRVNVFGYSAPRFDGMPQVFRDDYRGGIAKSDSEWPDFVISPASGNAVDLDGSHPDIVKDSWVVLSLPTNRELWQVDSVTELSRAEFAVSGKVTRLTLKGGENYSYFSKEVRDLTVFAVSELLTLVDQPDTSEVTGDTIVVDTDVTGMVPRRRLLVHGTTTAGEENVEDVAVKSADVDGDKWRLTLTGDLSTSYERDTVVVYGNVALATHGETVQQILGAGQASETFQRFTLAHDPLTYVQSATDPSGAVDTLAVRIDGVSWHEAPTLFGAGARDRSFALRTDEAAATYVQFGDGEHGSRVPTGLNNVQATYRKGLGAAGNVDPGALSLLVDRPLGVKGVSNPSAATGGVDPQDEASARVSIPLGVRALGRAVSLLDYEDFARAFSGVAKANAALLPLRAGPTIVVTVAFSGGDRIDDLSTSLRTFGDPTADVLVVAGTTGTFKLALKVAVDPDYDSDTVLGGVETALRDAYSFDVRDFVQPVFHSEIDAVAHSVAGVLAVDVDRLYTGSTASLSERLLAQQAAVGTDGSAIPAGLLVLDDAPFDWLEEMT